MAEPKRPKLEVCNLDYPLKQALKEWNVCTLNVKRVILSTDNEHWLLFINSVSWSKTNMNRMAGSHRFCRVDFIPNGMIALRVTKE